MRIVDALLLGGFFLISAQNISSLETPPHGCSWSHQLQQQDNEPPTLACRLRSIFEADGLFANLSTAIADEVELLSLECNETLLSESSLAAVNSNVSWDFLSVFSSLKCFSVDFCKISNLYGGTFEKAPKLRQLSLQRSHNAGWPATSLELDYNTLRGLSELRELNLGHNNISSLREEFFCPSFKIETLNLTDNVIQDVESINFAKSILACTSKLKTLDLSSNNLKKVRNSSFAGLGSLGLLMLQDNKIAEIESNAFNLLYNLRRLNISGNQLAFLPPKLFNDTRKLHEIDLSNNFLVILLPELFDGLDQLELLYLGHNNLTSRYIHRDSFSRLESLRHLDLAHNSLSVVNTDLFKNLSSLEYLNLEHNEIDTLAENCFASLTSLRELSLAYNKIVRVDGVPGVWISFGSKIYGVFRNLRELKYLNVSNNRLFRFNHGDLPTDLDTLDIHSNLINEMENLSLSDSNRLRIKVMDLSFNRIEEIFNSSIPAKMRELRLNDNRIRRIAAGTFKNTKLTKVVLSNNEIRQLEVAAIELQSNHSGVLPKFYLGGNPFLCNCRTQWLQKMNKSAEIYNLPRLMDFNSFTCDMEHTRVSSKRLLRSLKPQDFVCSYQTHYFSDCDCNITCPKNCSCYHDQSWSRNVVDCSNVGYRFVPEHISMIATEIYLDGNELGDLGSNQFISKNKLEILYLNNSGIKSLQKYTFNGVESLQVLHLESNALRELKGFEFDQLEHIRELYLDHNAIASVASTTFQKMKHLELLRLNNNRIVNFEPWEVFKGQKTIVSLEGNSWSCDCDNAIKLRNWLAEHKSNAAERMYCQNSGETAAQAIQFCSKLDPDAAVVKSTDNHIILFFIADNLLYLIASVFLVIFVICSTIYLYITLRSKKSSPDIFEVRDRLYDGYLIYSERDDEFVSRNLAAELEQSGLALCLHWRDLTSTRPQESMLLASAAAKRIVVFFSPLFFANEWQHSGFRDALQATLETIRPSSRRKHVIIVLATVTPVDDLELQLLLQTCTVLDWNDRSFWKKLRSAMFDRTENIIYEKHLRNSIKTSIPSRDKIWPLVTQDSWMANQSCGSSTSGAHSGRSSSIMTTPTPAPTHVICISRCQNEDHYCKRQHHHDHGALYSGGSFGAPKPASVTSSSSHLYSTIPEPE